MKPAPRRFFLRLYAAHAALLIGTAVLIGALLHTRLQRSLLERTEAELRTVVEMVGPWADEILVQPERASLLERALHASGQGGVRLTLIDPQGRVVLDSTGDPRDMENHLMREEVQQALVEPWGRALRSSPTLGIRMLYVAHVEREGERVLGFTRAAMPIGHIEEELATLRTTITWSTAVALALALVIGLAVARGITRPVAEITEVAQQLERGLYDARVRAMPDDEFGRLGHALNRLGEEITRRIASLSAEDAKLRAMLAGMVEGVIAVDEAEQVVFHNAAARRLLAIEPEQFVGRKLFELVRLWEFARLVEDARAGRPAFGRELVLRHGAREVVLQAHAQTFGLEGGGSGLVIVVHDISELRRLERIRRDFVANVSHELKTPLTAIRGYVETLLDGALEERDSAERFLRKIDTNVQRLTHLVTDLLSLARIESGEGVGALAPTDLRGLAEEALRRNEPQLRAKGLSSSIEQPEGPVVVMGDAEALQQVIGNLVDNAVRYTTEGRVTVRLLRRESRGVLEVEDTGFGIPEQDKERVFERFYRVDKARSREVGGTGLGLSIVKNLTLQMGGEVQLDSELGRGSCFRVLLPLA